tara:strand:+ start:99 stop:317 length:219 start_codon:yes stop_codon:yes gene_type:complete
MASKSSPDTGHREEPNNPAQPVQMVAVVKTAKNSFKLFINAPFYEVISWSNPKGTYLCLAMDFFLLAKLAPY